MPLLALALSHTTHPGLRSHIGPNSENLCYRSAFPLEKSKRSCNLSLRLGAKRISSEFGSGKLKPWQIPKRDWFSPEFIFGASSSAYQIEGAWDKGGKGPSSWDHFCKNHPHRIEGKTNGDVAANSYFMYKEDVRMLKEMGMDAYRFSISWPRILPKGTLDGGINHEGIAYYHNLIDCLKENGIEPYVTLFHWDIPQALEDTYGSFLNKSIVKDYTDYTKVCFEHFGDKVKHWITFNEPYIFCCNAYGKGRHAPGRSSPGSDGAIPEGDALKEPYIAGHHILLAHAEAVNLYNKCYKGVDGKIGMALDVMGYEPHGNTFLDDQACARSIDFHLGWFMEPLVRGDYPFSMRSIVGSRLPAFTKMEQEKLASSYDFVGLNYYTGRFSKHIDISPEFSGKLNSDDAYATLETTGIEGNVIGPKTGKEWILSYPKGLKDLLAVIKKKYGNPTIYITENGIGDLPNDETMKDPLDDWRRVDYLHQHISAIKEAIDLGADVRGHFTWSLIDSFEWVAGYSLRFGLIYVDREDGFKRHMKNSAKWFGHFNKAKKKINRKVLLPHNEDTGY